LTGAGCQPLLQIDDESIFPAQFGEAFAPSFQETVRTIFKRLFRVYAHIYHSHFKQASWGHACCQLQHARPFQAAGGGVPWVQHAGWLLTPAAGALLVVLCRCAAWGRRPT
jgi:hypothetical protein